MNRILFETAEIKNGCVEFSGERAAHVLDVLHGEVGQILKTGEINGKIGTGRISAIEGRTVTVRVSHDAESVRPWADVILAPPRPRAFKRLLPQLAALGAGRIAIVGAGKVEKDFWGATVLKEENFRPLLVEGLVQSGASILPEIVLRRNFRRFVEDELSAMFADDAFRVVAHPLPQAELPPVPGCGGRCLLAIGPEGGWLDEEVELLESKGFRRFSLGGRVLRTETATVAAMAVLGFCKACGGAARPENGARGNGLSQENKRREER